MELMDMAEEYRAILWGKFSLILKAMRLNPEDYLKDFNREYEAVKGFPLDAQQRVIEDLARAIVTEALTPPPVKPVKPPPPPPPPPSVPAVVPIPPPDVTTRYCVVDGTPFTAPDEATLFYLERLFPFPVEYWLSCSRCKRRYHGYPPASTMLREAVTWRKIDPYWWDWIQELAEKLGGE